MEVVSTNVHHGDGTGRVALCNQSIINLVLEQMPGSVILQPIVQKPIEEACEDRPFC